MLRRKPRVRTVTVTTLRTDVDRVKAFVAYHLRLGVDEMVLFFDDPEDPAMGEVQTLPGVTAVACDHEHWQSVRGSRPKGVQARQVTNVNSVLSSRRGEFDWLLHIDSDELIHAPKGLARTLEREGSGLTLLQMPVLEAVPSDPQEQDAFRSTVLFRRHQPELEQRARELNAASGYQGSTFLRGHVQGKPAVRLDGVVTRLRIHRAAEYDRARFTKGVSRDIHVLHYDAGSFSDWCTKWRDRDRFSRAGHQEARIAQWDEFVRLDALGDEAGLRALYHSYYMLPPEEIPILESIGLVERVDLDPSWFDWPA
jgi:hypothetical protein